MSGVDIKRLRTAGRRVTAALACSAAIGVAPSAAFALDANPAGELVTGSGEGVQTSTVYSPGMRFPIEETPAFANSQVYGHGGYLGPGGGQCDAANYDFPWVDNFCESRSYATPLCPAGQGHQGQDIRPGSCTDNAWWAVAAEAGTITGIGSYTVTLTTDSGRQYRYLHMSMDTLAVGNGDRVAQGDRLGLVSNDFGGTATTIHLHFEIRQNVTGLGVTHVPPYTSLVESYEALEVPPVPCPVLPAAGGVIDDSQSSCFRKYGNTTYWRPVNDAGEGGSFIWTHGFVAASPSNWAEWAVNLAEAGTYRVEASNASSWVTANGYNQSQDLTYRIEHAGRVAEFVVDQSAGDGWVTLGDVTFASGGDQSVAVLDNTGEDGAEQRKIVVDAIRLTRLDVGETCDEAACAADTGCTAWSACSFASGCALEGEEARTCTTYACDGEVCAGVPNVEVRACSRPELPASAEWTDVGVCALQNGASLCDNSGLLEQERHVCSGGNSVIESRTVSCERDSDGIVLSLWSTWSACAAGEQTSEREICMGGAATSDTRVRACGDTDTPDAGFSGRDSGNPRDVPNEDTSSAGCAAAGARGGQGGALGFAFGLLAALFVVRRRR